MIEGQGMLIIACQFSDIVGGACSQFCGGGSHVTQTPKRRRRIAAAVPPRDDRGCRGCGGTEDRCDGTNIAPACELLHRVVHERFLDAPCFLCFMLAGSQGELVPVVCEDAFRYTTADMLGELGRGVIDTITALEGQDVAASGSSWSEIASGMLKEIPRAREPRSQTY